MLSLPDSLREAFKEPFGPVYTTTDELLVAIDRADSQIEAGDTSDPVVIAVGDVVSHHLLAAGHQPDVAVIDGKTEREVVDDEVAASLANPDGRIRRVENPPATLTEELLVGLTEAIAADESVTIVVDGEEDLATLPALVAAPHGSSVVYGQPGAGMVHVAVTEAQAVEARDLLRQFDGDTAAALAVVGD